MSIFNLGAGGTPTLEARTVTPSTSQQIIKPSRDTYDGLSQVTVEATPLETRTVNPSTSSQTITPSGSNIGFSTVTVNPYRLQSKSVTPSTVPYTVSPDSGYNGLSGVTFGRDANLTAKNIVKGTTIYGVTGTSSQYGTTLTRLNVLNRTHTIVVPNVSFSHLSYFQLIININQSLWQQGDIAAYVNARRGEYVYWETNLYGYLQNSGGQMYWDSAPVDSSTHLGYAILEGNQITLQLNSVLYIPTGEHYIYMEGLI